MPNLPEDKKGVANRLFSTIYPWRERIQGIKKTKPHRYKLIKHTVNTVLLVLFIALIYGVISGIVVLIHL